MADAPSPHLRPAQRRRTRKAIVDATIELVARGVTPSVAEIAEAAEVSRRTVYLYFPTLEQLLLDATVGALSLTSVDEAIAAAHTTRRHPSAGIEALASAMCQQPAEVKELGRRLVRLTLDQGGTAEAPRRGYRRVQWIETALAPVREMLAPSAFDRLVSALSMVIGWEALVVLQDVRGLDTPGQDEASTWAARALVNAALTEAGEIPGR